MYPHGTGYRAGASAHVELSGQRNQQGVPINKLACVCDAYLLSDELLYKHDPGV